MTWVWLFVNIGFAAFLLALLYYAFRFFKNNSR